MNSSTSRSPNTATRTPANSSTIDEQPIARWRRCGHHGCRRIHAAAAIRSSAMAAGSTGRLRRASLDRPYPVRTRMPRAPAATPACTSVHLSPTVNERGEIELEVRGRLPQHAGPRLPAVAVAPVALDLGLGMMRAVVVAVDAAAARLTRSSTTCARGARTPPRTCRGRRPTDW